MFVRFSHAKRFIVSQYLFIHALLQRIRLAIRLGPKIIVEICKCHELFLLHDISTKMRILFLANVFFYSMNIQKVAKATTANNRLQFQYVDSLSIFWEQTCRCKNKIDPKWVSVALNHIKLINLYVSLSHSVSQPCTDASGLACCFCVWNV